MENENDKNSTDIQKLTIECPRCKDHVLWMDFGNHARKCVKDDEEGQQREGANREEPRILNNLALSNLEMETDDEDQALQEEIGQLLDTQTQHPPELPAENVTDGRASNITTGVLDMNAVEADPANTANLTLHEWRLIENTLIRRSTSSGYSSPILTRDLKEEERKRREKEKMENKKRDEEELGRKAEKFMKTFSSLSKDESMEDSEEEMFTLASVIESTYKYLPELVDEAPLTTTTTTTTTTSTANDAKSEIDAENDFQKHPAARQENMDTNESTEAEEVPGILTNNNNLSRRHARRRQEAHRGEEIVDESPIAAPPKRTKMDVEEQIVAVDEVKVAIEEIKPAKTVPPPCPSLTQCEQTRIDTLWKELEQNLEAILTKLGSIEMRWDDLWGNMYRQVFQLKTLTKGNESVREELYDKFKDFIRDHISKQREHLALMVAFGSSATQAELLLRSYLKKWADYVISSKYIHDIFSMHYFWVPKEKGVPDVFTLCLMLWKDHLFSALQNSTMEAILCLISVERQTGEKIKDPSLISSLIQNHIVLCLNGESPLDLFRDNFEKQFIENARQHYALEATKNMSVGVTYFMEKAEKSLEEEVNRVSQFASISVGSSKSICFSSSEITTVYHALLASCWTVCDSMLNLEASFAKATEELSTLLTTSLNSVLIESYKDAFAGVLPHLLNSGSWDDISRMYRLLTKIEATKAMETITSQHIKDVGFAIVDGFDTGEKKKSVEFVTEVYNLLVHYRMCMKKAYLNSASFKTILEQAITAISNKTAKAARYITQYIDEQQKGGFKDSNDQSVDRSCEMVIELLKYLNDKDIFQKYYTLDLAIRLVERSSVSTDYEKHMIAKLKSDQGVSFTCNMERMFKDVAISADVEAEFSSWYKPVVEEKQSKTELSPIIVSNGCWPSSVILRGASEQNSMDFSSLPLECILPPGVEAIWQTFKAYYLGRYHGRKLTFVSHLGSADVRYWIDAKKDFSLQCSTHMMCILTLFNTSDTLSFKDIKSVTNIPERHLKAALYSLACAKYSKSCNDKLLLKTPADKEIKESDLFTLNTSFKCKLKKLKLRTVNPLTREPSTKITAELEDQVLQERELQCDACIVRVMKSRKSLPHAQLVKSVIEQLTHRFQAQPQLIKKRIQILLDREFLARSPDDINTYVYVA